MSDGLEPTSDGHPYDPQRPSPDDRLWRHPSEMAELGPVTSLVAPPHTVRTSAALLTGVGICLAIAGGFLVAGWVSEPAPAHFAGSRVMLISSTTAVARSAWLGVGAIDSVEGVTVVHRELDSPAQAVLRDGDVIQGIDGVATPTLAELQTQIGRRDPGTMVSITLRRNRVDMVIQLQLAAQR